MGVGVGARDSHIDSNCVVSCVTALCTLPNAMSNILLVSESLRWPAAKPAHVCKTPTTDIFSSLAGK